MTMNMDEYGNGNDGYDTDGKDGAWRTGYSHRLPSAGVLFYLAYGD
jgi:hypothetical protein